MKCPNCGKEIANDSVFCEYCGTKVETAMPSATRFNWLKWLGVIAIAVGIVLGAAFLFYTWRYVGEGYFLITDLWGWTDCILPVIATFIVGGYAAYKVFDKKTSFTNKKTQFKWLLVLSSIILLLLAYLAAVMCDFHLDLHDMFVCCYHLCYRGYGVVYAGVICLYIWQAKQITK